MTLNSLYTYFDTNGVLKRRGAPVPPAPTPTILLDETFDTWTLGTGGPGGTWDSVYWNNRMAQGQASGVGSQLQRHTCIVNPDLGGRCMQLLLLAGIQGAGGSTGMMVPLKQSVDEINFEIKFKLGGGDGTYDFGLGQKIPGPSGARPGVQIDYAAGCNPITNQAMSCRCMQATHTGRPDGAGLTYMYGTDVTEGGWTCGEDGWWTPTGAPSTGPSDNVLMTPNAWHVMNTHVKLNTVTPTVLSNGIITTTWDGNTVFTRSNRKPRVTTDLHMTHFMWDWFYGGNTADWAPTTDQHIWIDYVKVTAP